MSEQEPVAPRPRKRTALVITVGCDQSHHLETIASGLLWGDRPEPTTAATLDLYRVCEDAARAFLGVPWRRTYTWLILSVPDWDVYQAGARWFRCDLAVNDAPMARHAVPVTGSLRGAAELIRCLHFLDDFEDLGSYLGVPVDCAQPHRVEVTGLFRMPDTLDPWRQWEAFEKQVTRRCWAYALDHLGVSTPDFPEELTFWGYYPHYQLELDRNVICFVVAPEGSLLVGSVKDLGPWGEITLVDA